jgi:hypothetical protein
VAAVTARDDGRPRRQVQVPVGGPALLGLVYPAFSAGPFAVRRAALERLGGFAPDARADEADHDLLNRLLLAGLRIEVVAEPLATRASADRWSHVRRALWADAVAWSYDSDAQLRVQRTFAAALPPELRDLPAMYRGLHDRAFELYDQVIGGSHSLQAQHSRLEELEYYVGHLEGQVRAVTQSRAWRGARTLRRAVGVARRGLRR